MKSVLVTGGAGFIGHHLVKELVKNHIVYVVDDLSSSVVDPSAEFHSHGVRSILPQMLGMYDRKKDPRSPGVVFVNSDFANQYVVEFINGFNIDTVYHLAAKPRVEWSVENPVESTTENFSKVLVLAKACADANARLVFSSTAAVYGNCDIVPTAETSPKKPESPYGLSKLCAENYLSLFENLYGLDWAALRYFNVYGPAQPGNSAYSTVVSAWCHKACVNEPLRSDGDGTQTRDMIYVDDVVSANVFIGSAPFLKERIYNVGSESSISNNKIRSFFTKRGYTEVEHAPKRKGDVKHTCADTTRLKNLGWKCKISFSEGISKVFDFWEL